MIVFMFSSSCVITVCSKVVSSVQFWFLSLSLTEDFPCLLMVKSRALHAAVGRVFTVGWFNCTIRQGTCISLFVFSHGLDSPENIFSVCCLAVSLSGAMLGQGDLSVSTVYLQILNLIPLFSV